VNRNKLYVSFYFSLLATLVYLYLSISVETLHARSLHKETSHPPSGHRLPSSCREFGRTPRANNSFRRPERGHPAPRVPTLSKAPHFLIEYRLAVIEPRCCLTAKSPVLAPAVIRQLTTRGATLLPDSCQSALTS